MKQRIKRGFKKRVTAETRTRQFILRQLVDKHGAVCAICGKKIESKKDCTIDHIKPLSKGGLTTLENCQIACFDCNQRKGDKWIIE